MNKAVDAKKAIHILEGLIEGIKLNEKIGECEIRELGRWCDQYRGAVNVHPFCELIAFTEKILKDGVITQSEMEDLTWFLDQIETGHAHTVNDPAEYQRFTGILYGIISDGIVEDKELDFIRKWFSVNALAMDNNALRELSFAVADMQSVNGIYCEEDKRMVFDKISLFRSKEAK